MSCYVQPPTTAAPPPPCPPPPPPPPSLPDVSQTDQRSPLWPCTMTPVGGVVGDQYTPPGGVRGRAVPQTTLSAPLVYLAGRSGASGVTGSRCPWSESRLSYSTAWCITTGGLEWTRLVYWINVHICVRKASCFMSVFFYVFWSLHIAHL